MLGWNTWCIFQIARISHDFQRFSAAAHALDKNLYHMQE